MDVDITTGLPLEAVRNQKLLEKAEEEAKLESIASKGLQIEQRLDTSDGQFFVALIVNLLQGRIDQLVQEDPQAQAIISVLNGLGQDIHAGKSAAYRLSMDSLRMSGNI